MVLSSLATLALAGEVPPLERFAAEVEAAYPNTPTLKVDAFLQLRSRSSFLVVDAREPAERAVSIIPGAITREALEQRAADSSTPILVYCTIGMRSAAVTRELREQGREAFNLKGGVLAWAAAGQPFVDEQGQPTQRVHVYGKRWSYLPAEFQAVW
jgi:rhodanese-related sulfurtransferase